MKLRRLLFPTLAVLLSLSVACLAVEVGLRLLKPAGIRLFPRYHEAVRYGDHVLRRTRPSFSFVHTSRDGRWVFHINRQGFRDGSDYSHERSPGVRRVLVLGDSQALGYENRQQDILPARLERELAEDGLAAEVINSGVSGFGTAEELVFLEQEGIRYRPDVVVLMFFANDYADNVRSGLFAVENGRLAEAGTSYAPGTRILAVVNSFAVLRWLGENSYLYSFLFNTGWNLAKGISNREANRDPFERTFARGEVPPHQKALARQLLGRMSAFLGERGIPLVIVDVPNLPADGRTRDFRTSIAQDEQSAMAALSTRLISSEQVLARHRGRVEFHRPNGERHVTPFVHAQLAAAVGTAIHPLLARGSP